MSARELLIQTVGPAMAFVRTEAAHARLRSYDLDLIRRQWIEQLTGVTEAGNPVSDAATLEGGQHDSLPRIQQMEDALLSMLASLRENPEQYGVHLVDR